MSRAQANLVALAVALLLVTAAVGVSLAVGSGALAGADGTARDRAAASGLAARLVADSRLTTAPNVLDRDALRSLDPAALRAAVPAARGAAVRITLDGDPVVRAGDATGGTTVRRLVLVERRRTETVALTTAAPVTLPPTDSATVTVDAPERVRVTSLRANGRVVARNASGLNGTVALDLRRANRTRLAVEASGPLPAGTVQVRYHPWNTTPAVLGVTVDA
jgi:hypothetical protein